MRIYRLNMGSSSLLGAYDAPFSQKSCSAASQSLRLPSAARPRRSWDATASLAMARPGTAPAAWAIFSLVALLWLAAPGGTDAQAAAGGRFVSQISVLKADTCEPFAGTEDPARVLIFILLLQAALGAGTGAHAAALRTTYFSRRLSSTRNTPRP